jgi:single-strand DNA-binding protein
MNCFIITGNLTADPVKRHLPSGIAVCEGVIAHNERYITAKGETREVVSFIPFELYGKGVDPFIRFHKKGSSVLFNGRIQEQRWEDKQTGQNRSKLVVNVTKWERVDFRHQSEDGPGDDPAPVPSLRERVKINTPRSAGQMVHDRGEDDDVLF